MGQFLDTLKEQPYVTEYDFFHALRHEGMIGKANYIAKTRLASIFDALKLISSEALEPFKNVAIQPEILSDSDFAKMLEKKKNGLKPDAHSAIMDIWSVCKQHTCDMLTEIAPILQEKKAYQTLSDLFEALSKRKFVSSDDLDTLKKAGFLEYGESSEFVVDIFPAADKEKRFVTNEDKEALVKLKALFKAQTNDCTKEIQDVIHATRAVMPIDLQEPKRLRTLYVEAVAAAFQLQQGSAKDEVRYLKGSAFSEVLQAYYKEVYNNAPESHHQKTTKDGVYYTPRNVKGSQFRSL